MVLSVKSRPSPNFDSREGNLIQFIIIHYTDMLSAEDALTRLCDPEAKVSAHYLIDKVGQVTQLVKDEDRAWHAGLSSWQGINGLNAHSIGIELDYPGHTFGLTTFPIEQIQSLLILLKQLINKHAINPQQIWGHSDIAPSRKTDPGEFFPWKDLATNGMGVWPAEPVRAEVNLDLNTLQGFLSEIGYDCPVTGQLDEHTRSVVRAFQRHYTPTEITGENSPNLSGWVRSVKDIVQWQKSLPRTQSQ